MLGDRLRLARKRARLSLRQLAALLDAPVSIQALSKYEANAMLPSVRVLGSLGRALGVSLDSLAGSQAVGEPAIVLRTDEDASAAELAALEADVRRHVEPCLTLFEILDQAPVADPFEALQQRVTSAAEAEALAEKLRHDWELGQGPLLSVTALLERCGILVLERSLPGGIALVDGEARPGQGRPPVPIVVVAENLSIEDRRVTLARELGRRLIADVGGTGVRLDRAIDRFAAAFLVPGRQLRTELGEPRQSVAYHEIRLLKHRYGVPAALLLLRLEQSGTLPAHVVTHAFRYGAAAWRNTEPDPLSWDTGIGVFERSTRLQALVFRALAEELIAPSRAAELLGTSMLMVQSGWRGPRAVSSPPSSVAASEDVVA